MKESKIELLDDVLFYLNLNTTWATLRKEFPEQEVSLERMKSTLRKLESDGYINRFDGAMLLQRERGYVNDTKIVRNTEGDLFIEAKGYKGQHHLKKSSQLFKNIKIGFEIIIALATIILSILSFRQADKISKIEEENELLKAKIESLGK